MADSRMREDVESAYLDITEYVGQSLTGPRELITRRILCSNPQVTMTEADAAQAGAAAHQVRTNLSNKLRQLNFRILSTSPGACLNAKVVLTLPLFLHHCRNSVHGALGTLANYEGGGGGGNLQGGFTIQTGMSQYAPRRNGILKACQSITSTINSTVSFTTRPSECVDVFEQIFTQEGVSGQTGIYNESESASWGNTDGFCGGGAAAIPINALASQGLARVRNIYAGCESAAVKTEPNKGFIERRADMRSGGGADPIGATQYAGISDYAHNVANNYIKYDYKTTLVIPPFKTFNKDIYCRSPSWIPYCDSCDLMLNFLDEFRVKEALLQCASMYESRNTSQDYDIGFYKQPFLTVEWVVPPVQLRPSYTLPCWRNQHFSQRIPFTAVEDGYKTCTFQGIRLDSMPSLISLHVTDGPDHKRMVNDAASIDALTGRYRWTEYNGRLSDVSVTVNEKIAVLSDKSDFELYQMYRMYAPDSKMSYTVWREFRQLILLRSDVLAVEKGQHVFNPTNITFNMKVGKALQHIGKACQQEVRLNFFYFSDALTLSQQAAAVTSMLLSPSDVQQLKVTPEAREIQTLMEMGLQG